MKHVLHNEFNYKKNLYLGKLLNEIYVVCPLKIFFSINKNEKPIISSEFYSQFISNFKKIKSKCVIFKLQYSKVKKKKKKTKSKNKKCITFH